MDSPHTKLFYATKNAWTTSTVRVHLTRSNTRITTIPTVWPTSFNRDCPLQRFSDLNTGWRQHLRTRVFPSLVCGRGRGRAFPSPALNDLNAFLTSSLSLSLSIEKLGFCEILKREEFQTVGCSGPQGHTTQLSQPKHGKARQNVKLTICWTGDERFRVCFLDERFRVCFQSGPQGHRLFSCHQILHPNFFFLFFLF